MLNVSTSPPNDIFTGFPASYICFSMVNPLTLFASAGSVPSRMVIEIGHDSIPGIVLTLFDARVLTAISVREDP